MASNYDAEAEALKLRKIELEVHELVEVEDEWTGHMREEEQLVYAGPAGSTVVDTLNAAHKAGAEEMQAERDALRLSLRNVLTLSRRMKRRAEKLNHPADVLENVGHLIRFCAEAGVVPSVLRALPTEPGEEVALPTSEEADAILTAAGLGPEDPRRSGTAFFQALKDGHSICPDCKKMTSTPGHYNDAHDGALLCTNPGEEAGT